MIQSKRLILMAVALAAALGGAGCATSLQPLGSEDVRADLAGIAGVWVLENTRHSTMQVGSQVRIERRGVGLHAVVLDQMGEKSAFHAELVKLGETMFVDLFPEVEADTEKPEGILVIGSHVFFVVEMKGKELRLYGFNHTKLDALAIEEKVAIASPRNQRLVFVAESKRLQEFFAKHGPANLQKEPLLVLKKAR